MTDMDRRVCWEKYFVDMARLVSARSTCLRRRVGAVAVKDRRVLATGYNGAPTGIRHCIEVGCIREELKVPSGERHELCRAVHAEQNVIVQAAKYGVSLDGAELYCTTAPCSICMKMLINVGIRSVYYVDGYPDQIAIDLAREAGLYFQHTLDEE